MGITSSWRMRVEEVFENRRTPPTLRRPDGHMKKGSTKKGNKKRGLRARLVGLSEEEDMCEDEDEEDKPAISGGQPPA